MLFCPDHNGFPHLPHAPQLRPQPRQQPRHHPQQPCRHPHRVPLPQVRAPRPQYPPLWSPRTSTGTCPDAQWSLPRRENVSSNAIRPTWAPFSSTLSAEERLVFSLRLMNGRWEAILTCGRGFSTLFPVRGSSGTQHPTGEANTPHGKHQRSCFWAEPWLWSHGSSGMAGVTPHPCQPGAALQRTGAPRDPSPVSNWAMFSTSKRRWAPRATCHCGCSWTAAWPPSAPALTPHPTTPSLTSMGEPRGPASAGRGDLPGC